MSAYGIAPLSFAAPYTIGNSGLKEKDCRMKQESSGPEFA